MLLRTFQAQIPQKIRTFSSGSASARKIDVLMKKKSVYHWQSPVYIILKFQLEEFTHYISSSLL